MIAKYTIGYVKQILSKLPIIDLIFLQNIASLQPLIIMKK